MKSKVTNEEIASLCLELSLLLHSGVGMGDALSLLAEEGERPELLSAMAEQVDGGALLSAALRDSGCFPLYVCGLVEVGERTGRTEEALPIWPWPPCPGTMRTGCAWPTGCAAPSSIRL